MPDEDPARGIERVADYLHAAEQKIAQALQRLIRLYGEDAPSVAEMRLAAAATARAAAQVRADASERMARRIGPG